MSIRSPSKKRSACSRPHRVRTAAFSLSSSLPAFDPTRRLRCSWNDIDFDREVIRVRRSINRFEGVGLPKTASSEREVDMLPNVRAVLKQQRSRSQLRSEFVFPSEVGGPLDLTNLRERNWRRLSAPDRVAPADALSVPAHVRRATALARREPAIHSSPDGTHDARNDHPALRSMDAKTGTSRPPGGATSAKLSPNLPEICQKIGGSAAFPRLESEPPNHYKVLIYKGK